MPPYLPPARMARDRLMSRLIQLPVVKDRIVMGGAQSLLCRSSSTSPDAPLTPISRSRLRLCDESEFRTRRPTPTDASQDVIGHLEDIGRTFQDIFGVIGEQIHFIFTSTWPTDPFQAALARLPSSTVISSRAYSYYVSYSAIAQFFGVELVKESDFDIALHPFHAPSCRALMFLHPAAAVTTAC